MDVSGVEALQYVGGDSFIANATMNPDNSCYGGDEYPSGVVNNSACKFESPVFVSYPHFYLADPFYTSQVDGMNPVKDKHQFIINLEKASKKTN